MKILNLEISNKSEDTIISIIEDKIKKNEKYLIHHINPHIILLSQKNKILENALHNFSELYCDGIGIYLSSRFLYGKNGLQKRMTGTDFYPKLLHLASINNLKVYFLGGSIGAHQKIMNVIKNKYTDLEIVGHLTNSDNIDDTTWQNIDTDILFVGLGSPKQEIWSYKNLNKINSKLIICVGSGIDYLSGVYKRAPQIFQKLGIEWFWRLLYDPKRLWKRYILGNFIYITKIILQKLEKQYAKS